MFNIPQSAAYTVMFKAFLATDHVTEATGKTIAITISKNGGAFANPSAGATNATEVSSGWYKVTLSTTDTNTVGPIAIRGAVATIDDVGLLYNVTDFITKIDTIDTVVDSIYAAVVTNAAGVDIAADIIALKAETATILADTDNIQTRIPAALVSGRMDSNMAAISDDATAADALETMLDGTGGNVLSLKQLNVVNSTGSAIVASSTGSNGHGIVASGNGSGEGLSATGGATGSGAEFVGGSTSGEGVYVRAATQGYGLRIEAADDGVTGERAGLLCKGSNTSGGSGANFRGGDSASALAGDGLVCSGYRDGTALVLETLVGTGSVATTTGNCLFLNAQAGVGHALLIKTNQTTPGNQHGVLIEASGTGNGINSFGGVTGNALRLAGGATSGDAIRITTTSGDGIDIAAAGGDGIKAASSSGGVDIRGNITGNLTGTINGLTATALADFFDTDSGTNYASAVAGSVVKEIADNAAGSGGGPTAATIAAAVWDLDATGHTTTGTFGAAIGDPVADTNSIFKAVVTDATAATVGLDVVALKTETASIQADTNDLQTQVGTAGAGLTNINLPNQTMDIIGNITGNLSGSVGSVTGAVGSVTGAVASVTGAVGSVTGNVGGNVTGSVGSVAANGITATSLDATAGVEIADAVLDRDMATGTDSGSTSVRTPRQALRMLRNKWSITAGVLTVTKENDTTASWTAAVTGTAGADPITTVDPA